METHIIFTKSNQIFFYPPTLLFCGIQNHMKGEKRKFRWKSLSNIRILYAAL